MKKIKILFFILFISFIFIYSISGCIESDAKNESDIGEDFIFIELEGVEKNLKNYRGKIVILDMWATWCGPCGYQMLELEKLNNYYSKDIIEILSINIDPKETIKMVQDYKIEFQKNGINLDWIFGMDSGEIWEKYKINGGIPTLYIFDQKGKIHYYHEGVSVFSEIPDGWPENTVKLKEKIDELIK
jgi:thiol-disulfide isomerase/thioredoxin